MNDLYLLSVYGGYHSNSLTGSTSVDSGYHSYILTG